MDAQSLDAKTWLRPLPNPPRYRGETKCYIRAGALVMTALKCCEFQTPREDVLLLKHILPASLFIID